MFIHSGYSFDFSLPKKGELQVNLKFFIIWKEFIVVLWI
jgi:hypothetical protein